MRLQTREHSILELEGEVRITTEIETVISWRRDVAGVHLLNGTKRPTAILVQVGTQQLVFDIPRDAGYGR